MSSFLQQTRKRMLYFFLNKIKKTLIKLTKDTPVPHKKNQRSRPYIGPECTINGDTPMCQIWYSYNKEQSRSCILKI